MTSAAAKLRICVVCDEEFDPTHPKKKLAGGKIDVCGDCVGEEVPRHVAFIDAAGKSDYRVEIIRDPTPGELAMVRTQGRCGPGMCHSSLGLSSNGASTAKDKMDAVHSKLYDEVQP